MKAIRKSEICFALTILLLVQSMIGCAVTKSGNNDSIMPAGEVSSETIATTTPKPTASSTFEPTPTPDTISDEQLIVAWTELHNALYTKFVDYSTTAEYCMPDKKSITWSSFIYPWRNDMETLKASYDELAQESRNGADSYQYEIVIDFFNSAYGELMTCWMIASDVINGDSTKEEFDFAAHAAFIGNTQNDLNNMREWLISQGVDQNVISGSNESEVNSAGAIQTESSNESEFEKLVKALNGVWVERNASTFGANTYFQISGTTVRIDNSPFSNSSSTPTFFMFGILEEGNGYAICAPEHNYSWPFEGELIYEFSLDANGNLVLETGGDISYNMYDGIYVRVE